MAAQNFAPNFPPIVTLHNRSYTLTPLSVELIEDLEHEARAGSHTYLKTLLEKFRNSPNNLDLQKQILGILFLKEKELFEKSKNKNVFNTLLFEFRKIAVLIDTAIPECLDLFPLWQNKFNFSLDHHYAARGDVDALKRSLTSSNPTFPHDVYGFSPLFDAYCHDQTKVQDFLRDQFQHTPESWVQVSITRFDEECQEQWTLLHCLARVGDRDVLDKVLRHCPKINLMCQRNDGPWPIHFAIREGYYKLLPLLYDKKMKNTPHLGRFLIHHVAECFDRPHAIETLKYVVSLGEELNHVQEEMQFDDQNTVLGLTALGEILFVNVEDTQLLDLLPQRLAFARELLRLGADINQLSSYACCTSLTPSSGPDLSSLSTMSLSSKNGAALKPEEIKAFEEEMIRRTKLAVQMHSPQRVPSQPQKHSLLQACIYHIGFPNPNTAVVDAVQNNRKKYFLTVMHFLIQEGIRLDHRDLNGLTALERAKKEKRPAAAIQLLENHEKVLNPASGGESELRKHIGNNAPLVMQYLYVTARQSKTYIIAATATQPTPKPHARN